jgi:hypothetical protein
MAAKMDERMVALLVVMRVAKKAGKLVLQLDY